MALQAMSASDKGIVEQTQEKLAALKLQLPELEGKAHKKERTQVNKEIYRLENDEAYVAAMKAKQEVSRAERAADEAAAEATAERERLLEEAEAERERLLEETEADAAGISVAQLRERRAAERRAAEKAAAAAAAALEREAVVAIGGMLVRLIGMSGPNSPRFGATSTGTYELSCFACNHEEEWTENHSYVPLTGCSVDRGVTSRNPQACPQCGASNGTLHESAARRRALQ